MSNSKKIKSRYDLGRNVRNFMDAEELEAYKKLLPENWKMVELRALEFALLEEIQLNNENGFKPSVASLSGDLETRVGLVSPALGSLKTKGLVSASGSAETKRYSITPKGQRRLSQGPAVVRPLTEV